MPTVPGTWLTSRPSGARLHFLFKYQEAFAHDTNTSTAWIETVWSQAAGLKTDLFESAKYLGGKPRLDRTLPYSSSYYPGVHFIDRMDLEGFQPETPDTLHVQSDPLTGWIALNGYAQYRLTFSNRNYPVLDDATVDALAAAKNAITPGCCVPEMFRWLRITRRYLPESRKIPTAGFEVFDDGVTAPPVRPVFKPFVIQEVGSIPTFQVEIVAESLFWPYANFPDGGIQACLGTVNQTDLFLAGVTYPKGTLLYKGPAAEITPYKWVDNNFYVDVPHLFGFRPQGWNTHRLNAPIAADGNKQWYPIRVKGVAGNQPQFQSGTHTSVFTPEPAH